MTLKMMRYEYICLHINCLNVLSYRQPEAPVSVWILLRKWWALQGRWPRRCTAEACYCPAHHTSTSVLHTHTYTHSSNFISVLMQQRTKPFNNHFIHLSRFIWREQIPLCPLLCYFFDLLLHLCFSYAFSSSDRFLRLILHLAIYDQIIL